MYMGYLQNGFLAVYLALVPQLRSADHVTNGLDFHLGQQCRVDVRHTGFRGPLASLSSEPEPEPEPEPEQA